MTLTQEQAYARIEAYLNAAVSDNQPADVWAFPVNHTSGPVSAIQTLANCETNTNALLAFVRAMGGVVDPALTNITLAEVESFRSTPSGAGVPSWIKTFYPPDDNTEALMVDLINKAKSSIIISMYGFADEPVAAALAARWNDPALEIKVMVNHDGYTADATSTMHTVIDAHPEFHKSDRFILGTSSYGNRIMHRKLTIIDGVWRTSGSDNWDDSSMKHQGNEMTVIYNQAIAAEARAAFDRLWNYNIAKGPAAYQVP